MGLFNFFKKEQKPQTESGSILLAMPMFNNGGTFELDKVIDNLRSQWNYEITDLEGNDEAAAFMIEGETIALAPVPVPIPWEDIEGTAQYAYNWPKALDDLKNHTGHAILSMLNGQKKASERFSILSKVLGSILITSDDAVGVYQGEQSLLIPRKQYLDQIGLLREGAIPVMLWVYIGLKKFNSGNCAYTYGLKSFQKPEIEIIDSKLSLEELYDLLYNITSYVIDSNVTLKNRETIGLTAEQKIGITYSKGQFVEGQSIKLQL